MPNDYPPKKFWDDKFWGITPREVLAFLALMAVLIFAGFGAQP